MSTTKKLSYLIKRQLPQYIREDHPNFIEFLEAYYEYLEQDGKAVEFAKNLPSYQDIDTTIDQFLIYFKKEFLSKIPEKLFVDPGDPTRTVDKRKLLKNIKQFYRARGTEKSYKFLFRILFDTEIDFYYPRVDMLRVSDGKWFQDLTIRVRQLSGNPFDLVGQKIRGVSSNTTAFVEHIQKISVGPLEVYELFLNRSNVLGQFLANEFIECDTKPDVSCKTYHLLVGINIDHAGEGYSIGDEITITQNGPGYGAKAIVENVDENGAVLKARIIDYGAGYSTGVPTGQIIFPATADTAQGTGIIGGQTLYAGYFLNDDGKLSNAKFIQDSYYYQQFSYVIKVDQSIETYRTLVKELIHPAGLILFGEFFDQILSNVGVNISASSPGSFIYIKRDVGFEPQGLYGADVSPDYIIQGYEQNLWHYDGYTKSSFQDSHPSQGYVIQAKIRVAQALRTIRPVVDQLELGEVSTFKLGPNRRSIEQFKFKYQPSDQTPNDNVNLVGVNANYWDQYGNLQINHLANYTIDDITIDFRKKINIMPEPVTRTAF